MLTGLVIRAAVLAFPLALCAQSVVSVHSGVVHYFEGSVNIDGHPLEQRFGHFEEIRPGSELRTDRGRVEILLTSGVLLRVDENSSIRMLSNRLTDTRVAFVGGSVAIDSRNGSADAPIAIIFQSYEVHFRAPGCYRFDSAPPRLRIDAGAAEVALNGKTVAAAANHIVSLTPALTTRSYVDNRDDGLDRWTQKRTQTVAADNASSAASDSMVADLDNPQNPAYGGGYGYGGGYDLGVDPAFMSPSDWWYTNGSMLSRYPSSLYSGQLFGYIFVPVYRRAPLLGYRPYEPIRHGPYVPPPSHRPLVHTTPPVVRHSFSGGSAIHAAGRH